MTTTTEPRLFGIEAVPLVVRFPATAMVRYLYEDDEPTGDFVSLDVEALATAHPGRWADLMAAEHLTLRLRVSDFIHEHVAANEATLLGFADWPAAVGWGGQPSRFHDARIIVDDVAVAKVVAFELARTGRTPAEESVLLVASSG